MEELKRLMLEGFAKLGEDIAQIKQKQDSMEKRLISVEQKQDAMEQRLVSIEQKQDAMEQSLVSVEQKQDAMALQLVRMEEKLDTNLGALYDFREVISDRVRDIASAVSRVESRLDKSELRALQGSLLASKITVRK